MRKILIAIAVAASVTAVSAAVFAAAFPDLPASHWAYDAVMSMAEENIVNGYPTGDFKPSDTVTYGEFIKMAHIARGGEELVSDGAAGSDWALPYHEAAVRDGLYSEHDITRHVLSLPIPREYMALVLSRVLGNAEIADYEKVQEKLSDITADTPREYDITKVTAYGLITGYPDRTFKPAETLTRAEAATVIYRLINPNERQLPDLRPAEEKTPLERLSDVPEWNLNPLLVVVQASASKRPISEVIDDAVFNSIDEPVLYYEIFDDYPYQMKKVLNFVGREVIAVGQQGMKGFLIRNRKVIANIESGRTEDGTDTVYVSYGEGYGSQTYPEFDYIAIKPANKDVLLLIPNNMR
ncbi:MAG: S-layer homology domain-containing protein [Clostridiales Family XIII bacterium]|nr:S-layer homology domain-containing protein [Clostridiales Family XIII bacterium]